MLTNGKSRGSLLLVKGAPAVWPPLCTKWTGRHSNGADGVEQRADVLAQIYNLAGDGLCRIAVLHRVRGSGPTHDVVPQRMKPISFPGCALLPIRPSRRRQQPSPGSQQAGIRLKILSGDDPVVVKRLAGLVGLENRYGPRGPILSRSATTPWRSKYSTVERHGMFSRRDDKVANYKNTLQARSLVGFLGDGINDGAGAEGCGHRPPPDGATGVAQAAVVRFLSNWTWGSRHGVAGGFADFCQHSEICLCQLKFRQHAVDGRGLDCAAISADVADAVSYSTTAIDLSEIGIPFDTVRSEATVRPQVWDIRCGLRFGAMMGPLSSLFLVWTFPFQGIARRIPDRLVSRVDGDANPRHLRRSYSAAARGRIFPILLDSVVADRTGRGDGASLHAAGHWFGFEAPPPLMLSWHRLVVIVYLILYNF